MDATINSNKRIKCANHLHRSLMCLFIVFATTTTLLKLYQSVDNHIFRHLYASNKRILV